MRFVKKSSKTTRSNPWTRSTASSKRRLSTSNAIPRSSNPSHPSPISPSHCDMELVYEVSNDLTARDFGLSEGDALKLARALQYYAENGTPSEKLSVDE